MILDIYKYEEDLISKGYKYIAGTDEAGRGPMAGPLVAAAVVLPKGYRLDYLNDSKQLSKKRRDELFNIIYRDAVDVTVTIIDVNTVDKINVLESSRLAMTECIKKMEVPVDYVLTDCMKLNINIEYLDLIKGDCKSASIAAASIIAKVTRDRIMEELDKEYPMYGFAKHKGYVTKLHLQKLEEYGICKYHRKSFAPVKQYIKEL